MASTTPLDVPPAIGIVNYMQAFKLLQRENLSTDQAAKALGVSKSTLLRWFREGRIAEVARDRNNWRVFTAHDIERIRKAL
jgi:excisionase family DNA binding protein